MAQHGDALETLNPLVSLLDESASVLHPLSLVLGAPRQTDKAIQYTLVATAAVPSVPVPVMATLRVERA